ncbi:MAG: C45 family autoproteolytic acyltransferase/hydrolase [Aureispira sp.]
MRRLKKWGKRLLYFFLFLIVALLVLDWWLNLSPPEIEDTSAWQLKRTQVDATTYTLGNNWLRKNKFGLWEAYVEGAPFERGAILGNLAQELIVQQEVYFVRQIKQLVDSEAFLYVLRYLVGFFNRNLPHYIPIEYQQEIYGETAFYSDEFTAIGSNYERALNYHAAHDIGHALSDYAIVGCTSFATWDSSSASQQLLIGRNFDFYVGEDFAKDKMILFIQPDSGYSLASVTWGGFLGVVSGMNEKGLTVTLNAAKSGLPSAAKTPISIVARQILQYAKNIEEAFAIAQQYETFVSESLLIGSAEDGRAAIIEKSVDQLALYETATSQLICSNHYQSDSFASDPDNLYNIKHSASNYRQIRTQALLNQYGPLDYQEAVAMLRDTKGHDNKNIGLGNEKALNQLQGHHGVVFNPEKRLLWVSTSPYQLGAFVAYDLNTIFNASISPQEDQYIDSLTVAPDPLATSPAFVDYVQFRALKQQVLKWTDDGQAYQEIQGQAAAELTTLNPNYYHAYALLGDYYKEKGQCILAIPNYKTALTLEIATKEEKSAIQEALLACQNPK